MWLQRSASTWREVRHLPQRVSAGSDHMRHIPGVVGARRLPVGQVAAQRAADTGQRESDQAEPSAQGVAVSRERAMREAVNTPTAATSDRACTRPTRCCWRWSSAQSPHPETAAGRAPSPRVRKDVRTPNPAGVRVDDVAVQDVVEPGLEIQRGPRQGGPVPVHVAALLPRRRRRQRRRRQSPTPETTSPRIPGHGTVLRHQAGQFRLDQLVVGPGVTLSQLPYF